MRWLLTVLVDALIDFARRTPYSHLYHADESLYMERWWVIRPRAWLPFALRVHHIATHDLDPHCHDHPWSFVSLVLRGRYIEARPVDLDPCFLGEYENVGFTERKAGSIAFRRCVDRHRIIHVSPDCYTLVLTTKKLHAWGFFTPHGKVHWKQYPSCHALLARSEAAPP